MRRAAAALLAALTALVPARYAFAGTVNDVPSCYVANKLPVPAAAPARELFILIDQTTLFDDTLQRSIFENVWGFLEADTAYTVVSFSAFSQGRYTEVVSAGRIEPRFPESERDATSVRLLKTFDECMKGQLGFARKRALDAVKRSLAASSGELAKSDILAALKDLSSRVRASPAKDKVLLLASDMLENSSVTSFYAGSTRVRTIDPAKELAAAGSAGMLADFGTARVHVIGAGLLGPQADAKAYRDAKTLSALADFWARYLAKSGAKLEQFGQPALLQAVR